MKLVLIVLAQSFRSHLPTVGPNFSVTVKNYPDHPTESDLSNYCRYYFPPTQVLPLNRSSIPFSTRSSNLLGSGMLALKLRFNYHKVRCIPFTSWYFEINRPAYLSKIVMFLKIFFSGKYLINLGKSNLIIIFKIFYELVYGKPAYFYFQSNTYYKNYDSQLY